MLLDFLKEARLDRVGCFKYSPVEGADANALPDRVPEEVKKNAGTVSCSCSSRFPPSACKVGREILVIIDEVDRRRRDWSQHGRCTGNRRRGLSQW